MFLHRSSVDTIWWHLQLIFKPTSADIRHFIKKSEKVPTSFMDGSLARPILLQKGGGCLKNLELRRPPSTRDSNENGLRRQLICLFHFNYINNKRKFKTSKVNIIAEKGWLPYKISSCALKRL